MSRATPLNAEFDRVVLDAPLPRHVYTGFMRYRDLRPIASGGKADVYRCVDGNLGREVALKVLRRELADIPLEQQLLVREARIMAALRHRTIPEIHDLGRDGDFRPYFAMSLKVGATLHDVLSAIRRRDESALRAYDLERLLGILVQAAAALEYAHDRNVVHCDLKPENLILEGRDSVALIDWGLAVIDDYADPAAANPAAAMRGCQGSALYMAPEQVANDRRLGPAVDVYGLGAVLYECLTLDTPHRGACVEESLRNVLHRDPCSPRVAAPERGISAELERTCLRALQKSPDRRFATMTEFRAALEDARTELLLAFERPGWAASAGVCDRLFCDDAADQQRPTQPHVLA